MVVVVVVVVVAIVVGGGGVIVVAVVVVVDVVVVAVCEPFLTHKYGANVDLINATLKLRSRQMFQ